ncbi:aspartyl-phosphate phosphatase Spo0E family protein [Desulforamulus aquiferis]|uniref:Aspartyl-phosphate phosphatase Spo0E family protein n=1 Tax=Desulforamulus aquiferis TaxID=1397668 RepID=A0AAW7ZDT6_9FIRM|nr:aspartyl-phosphate phosphatase Spo0E family protein [Desulforamulus aquiferis]MDO7787221.1 aspartyl-phosphate phosphatase Spo0E family protein [Desulforamulus aquiferis]RYD02710.1 hypothetical protein N752_23305 [Desulforamulus aquiferis]
MIIIRSAANKDIERLRKKLATISIDKPLSHPDVLQLSHRLDSEINKFMKQSKINASK